MLSNDRRKQSRSEESTPGSSAENPADFSLTRDGLALLSVFDTAPEFVRSNGEIWKHKSSINSEQSSGGITHVYHKLPK